MLKTFVASLAIFAISLSALAIGTPKAAPKAAVRPGERVIEPGKEGAKAHEGAPVMGAKEISTQQIHEAAQKFQTIEKAEAGKDQVTSDNAKALKTDLLKILAIEDAGVRAEKLKELAKKKGLEDETDLVNCGM